MLQKNLNDNVNKMQRDFEMIEAKMNKVVNNCDAKLKDLTRRVKITLGKY